MGQEMRASLINISDLLSSDQEELFCLNQVKDGHLQGNRRKSLSPEKQERLTFCSTISIFDVMWYWS